MIIVTGQALLQFTGLQKTIFTHSTTQFAHERHVFAHVTRQLPEFRVLLDETLHVGDRFDVCVIFGLGLILLDIVLDGAAQVAEVEIHVLLEEWVLILGKHNFLCT